MEGEAVRVIVVALLLGAAVVACDGRPVGPSHGIVVAMEYDDPDEWQTCSYRDAKTSACYSWTTNRDGPHWWIELRRNGRRGWREVPKRIYELCSRREPCDTRGRR